MPNGERETARIHNVLIILAVILISAIVFEFIGDKGNSLIKEIRVEPEARRYFYTPGASFRTGFFEPEVDLTETEKEIILRCDLPGVNKDEISIQVKGNYLVITGRRDIAKDETAEGVYYYKERRMGYFERSVLLPGLVIEEGVKAEYKDGILTVTLPRQKPAKRKGKIQVI